MNISDILFEQPTINPESFHTVVELPADPEGNKGYKIYDKETKKLIRSFTGPNAATAAEAFVDKKDAEKAEYLRRQKLRQEKAGTKEQRKAIAQSGWKGLFKGKAFYKIFKLLTLIDRVGDVMMYTRRYLIAYVDNGCNDERNDSNKSRYRQGKTVHDDMEWIRQRLADTFATIGVQIVTGFISGTLVGFSITRILSALAGILIIISGGTLLVPVIGILLGFAAGYFVTDLEKKFATQFKKMGTTLGGVLYHFMWIDLVATALPKCNEAAGLQKNNLLLEQKKLTEAESASADKVQELSDIVNDLWDQLLGTLSKKMQKFLNFSIDKIKAMAS